jgi:hypothetical protein
MAAVLVYGAIFVGIPMAIALFMLWRFMRDVHQISKALWAIHHCIQHPAQAAAPPLPHIEPRHAGVAMSQFGR